MSDADTPPAWAQPGTIVEYRPHIGHEPWYLGMITGTPRLLGGTWTVAVGRMEHSYGRGGGVAAAALDALKPVAGAEGIARASRVAKLEAVAEAARVILRTPGASYPLELIDALDALDEADS